MVLARDDVGTITFEQWKRREQADEPPVECPPPVRPRPPPVKRRSWVDELERRACRCRGCGAWVFDGPYCDWCDQGDSVTEAEKRYTQRGFRVFGERERTADEWLYGRPAVISVVESSIAARGAHVRIYEGSECVQMNVAEAEMVADALREFVAEAEANHLTEPPRVA